MPEISKHAIAQFLRTKCLRQLRLNLHPSKYPYIQERNLYGMPPFQIPSTGLASLAKMGQVWESQKFLDLETAFGKYHVYGNKNPENNNYSRISLLSQLNKLPKKGDFLIESEFDCPQSFLQNYNLYENYRSLKISFANLRPDIIQILPETNPDRSYINSIGEICYLPENDTRKILRIIDIKLMSEPSPCYFAEVVYYSIILANWLNDHGQNNSYVVSSNSAVWFGSHEKSHLLKQFESKKDIESKATDLHSSFLKDIYIAPYYSIFDTISHFLKFLVPKVLKEDWESFLSDSISIKRCFHYFAKKWNKIYVIRQIQNFGAMQHS